MKRESSSPLRPVLTKRERSSPPRPVSTRHTPPAPCPVPPRPVSPPVSPAPVSHTHLLPPHPVSPASVSPQPILPRMDSAARSHRPFKINTGEYYLARLEQDDESDPPFCIFLCIQKGRQTDPSQQGDSWKYPGAFTQKWLPVKWETWESCTWKGEPTSKEVRKNPFHFEDNMESDEMEWKKASWSGNSGLLTRRSVENIKYYQGRWACPELAQPRPELAQPRLAIPLAATDPPHPCCHVCFEAKLPRLFHLPWGVPLCPQDPRQ